MPFHGSVPPNRMLSSTGLLSVQLKRSYRLHASIKVGTSLHLNQLMRISTRLEELSSAMAVLGHFKVA